MATGFRAVVEDPAPLVEDTSLPEIPGLVDFVAAGSNAEGEFRCADCGYGAVVQHVVPPCPMCRGTVWERREPLEARLDN